MNSEEEIFEAASALRGAERAAYLDIACATQPQMRARIEVLLQSHEARGFMDGITWTSDAEVEQAGTPPEAREERIGRYRLVEQIGEGGFGVVWVAEQLEPVRRHVALKIIKPGMDSREVIARFEAERQALAMMDHPNIAKVFDAGTTEAGRPFFAMELVRGVRITEFCDQANMPTEERLRLFATVCQAVQHAHQKGIIHRDLKPSNILVAAGDDGLAAPKVIDFGVAKAIGPAVTDGTVYTQFEQMIGTPAYMSPEQAGLGPMDIDTRSDIYSLGILLYELLTGRPPFGPKELLDAGLEEMRRVIREVDPPKPSTRLTRLQLAGRNSGGTKSTLRAPHSAMVQDLDWIVMKALEKDRTRRYETANGLALDIQRLLASEPVSAGPPTAGYKFRKFATRNRMALRVAAAVVAVLVAATAVSLWQAVRATNAEKLARVNADGERTAREDAESVSNFLTHVFESPDPSRDGRTITVAEMLDRATSKLDTELANQPERRAKLLGALGRTYHSLGLYLEAARLHEKVRDYFLKKYGLRHRGTLHAMHELALSLHDAGRSDEARALWEEVLPRSREVNGTEDPDTLAAGNGLAMSYLDSGDRTEVLKAQAMIMELLPLFSKVFGPEHSDTIMVMHNLALTYYATGRAEEAIAMQEQVLPLDRKVNGPEAPETLKTMHNLAVSYSDTGRLKEAIELNEQVLTLRQKRLSPEHPDTLNAMNSLAASLASSDHLDEAIPLLEKSVDIAGRSLPPGHRIATDSMQNLARAYHQAGRPNEAIALRERVVRLLQDAFGLENTDTLEAMTALADDYNEAGRAREEMGLQEQVLPLLQKVRGKTHPTTLTTQINLALCHADAGHGDKAIEMLQEALTLSRQALPPDPEVVLNAMHNLGRACSENNRIEEAIALQERLVPECREVKGLEHPDTINAMHSLAFSYARAGHWVDALPLQEEVLAIGRRVLSADDAQLPGTMQFMADIYEKTGDQEKASALREEAGALLRNAALEPEPKSVAGARRSMADLDEKVRRTAEADAPRKHLADLRSPPPSNSRPTPDPARPRAQPITPPVGQQDSRTLVAPDSEWKWLHPTDGSDPGQKLPGFHKAFAQLGFDDSKWSRGKDSDGPTGGFGYGLHFAGVDIGFPEDKTQRWSAYFRHAFTTEKVHRHLELRCQRDDGIIVYLDGKEVVRDNVEPGEEAYHLRAVEAVDEDDDSVVQRYPIPGEFAPGPHVLAISVHNSSPSSTDLRLGAVSLVDEESQEKPD